MRKLAIIGASYLQDPLIRKAKEMGIQTHVFAWAANDIGERTADFFYPISIIEKNAILAKCEEIGVDGIVTIASDLAAVTVGYVAHAMGLTCNSPSCVARSTDKHLMREAFNRRGDPSPRSYAIRSADDADTIDFSYPVIVKPSDRSGSRGITKLETSEGLSDAVAHALNESLSGIALVEEFAEGREFSVEFASWQGRHHFLALTEKFTTGSPAFIEIGHMQPARVSVETLELITNVVSHALDSLGVEFGASHSEVKVDSFGGIKIIEIGARMGGDFIGSALVELSTGYDFLKAVIDIALGVEPEFSDRPKSEAAAGVRFVFNETDAAILREFCADNADMVVASDLPETIDHVVTDSSNRMGYVLFASNDPARVGRVFDDIESALS